MCQIFHEWMIIIPKITASKVIDSERAVSHICLHLRLINNMAD
jgi:hypothetical protein